MSAPALPHTPRSRVVIGLLLAVLVQALLLAMLRLSPPKIGTRVQTLLEFRLMADRPRNVAVSKAQDHPHVALRPDFPMDAEVSPMPPQLGAPQPELSAPPSPVQADANSAVVARPAPLNLALPARSPASGPRPESMLSQMLNDPRSNSAKRTLEGAIADAAGTLPVEVSRSTDGLGSTLIRQGSKCYRVTPSRMQTIDPMNDRLKGLPAEWSKCVNN